MRGLNWRKRGPSPSRPADPPLHDVEDLLAIPSAAWAQATPQRSQKAAAAEAERDFEGFWARLARETLLWSKPFSKVLDQSRAPFFRWFYDGELNASYNCLDRHLKTQPDKVAIIFEADDGKVTKISYQQLYHEVCRFANALKAKGIRKSDRVLIYMPMSIQAVVAMQACARSAATHSVVFGGFSAKSVQERIIDAGAVAVLTADEQMRGGRAIALKAAVDEALGMGSCESIKSVVVYKRTGGEVAHPLLGVGAEPPQPGQRAALQALGPGPLRQPPRVLSGDLRGGRLHLLHRAPRPAAVPGGGGTDRVLDGTRLPADGLTE